MILPFNPTVANPNDVPLRWQAVVVRGVTRTLGARYLARPTVFTDGWGSLSTGVMAGRNLLVQYGYAVRDSGSPPPSVTVAVDGGLFTAP
jgi:hypothetical protein